MTPTELKALRESTGLSQEKYANIVLGTTSATVSRWESGTCKMPALVAVGVRTKTEQWLKANPKA